MQLTAPLYHAKRTLYATLSRRQYGFFCLTIRYAPSMNSGSIYMPSRKKMLLACAMANWLNA